MIQDLFEKLFSSFLGWLDVWQTTICKVLKKKRQPSARLTWTKKKSRTKNEETMPFFGDAFWPLRSPKLQSDSSCHTGHDPFVKLLLLPVFSNQGRIPRLLKHHESAFHTRTYFNPFGWLMILLGLRNTLRPVLPWLWPEMGLQAIIEFQRRSTILNNQTYSLLRKSLSQSLKWKFHQFPALAVAFTLGCSLSQQP